MTLPVVLPTTPGPPDPNEDFIFDIDEAIKAKFDRMLTVSDEVGSTNTRPVRFFFRWPQVEVTDQTFPFGTIDLLRFPRAADREQRSEDPWLGYAPKGYTLPDEDSGEFLHTDEMPIPFDFVYQITLHARHNLHDRQMAYQMLQNDLLPPRGGYLVVGDTVRPLFADGPVDATGMDPAPGGRPKRHFRKVWTAVTQGELFQKDIEVLSQATSILTDVSLTT